MRTRVVGVAVLGVWMAVQPTPALADNIIGVSKASAQKIAQLLTPGQILVWNCPTCRGVQVIRVERSQVLPWGLSPDFAVMVTRDLLIRSGKTFEALDGMRCADPASRDVDAEPDGWPVDLTYTYWQSGKAGEYVAIGRSVGVDNNPVPTITLSPEALANIGRCAAKHLRNPAGMDEPGDPLVERLVSRNTELRAAATEQLRATINRMASPERDRLLLALIEELGDVGTIEGGPGTSEHAQEALLAAGPGAVSHLTRTVTDGDVDVVTRDMAARVLGRIRPPAQASIPALATLLVKEYRSPPRGGVAFALGAMGQATPQVLQALSQALAYRYPPDDRLDLGSYAEIAIALKTLGGRTTEAVPVLLRSLEEENPFDRVVAALALVRIDSGNRKPLTVLSDILKDPSLGEVHDAMLQAIQEAGLAVKDVVPVLIQALDAKDRTIDRDKLVAALESIGTPAAREAARRYR